MTNNMFFIANWKMFGDFKSVNSIKKVIDLSKNKKYKKTKIVYCPPYILIDKVLRLVKNSKIEVGAQNCHYSENPGPFTGSINTDLIKFKSYLLRRYHKEPMAYILGYKHFWKHKFLTNKSVLIPRPDTELIVEETLKHLPIDKS